MSEHTTQAIVDQTDEVRELREELEFMTSHIRALNSLVALAVMMVFHSNPDAFKGLDVVGKLDAISDGGVFTR